MRVRVSGGSSWMYGQSLRNDMLSNTLLSRSRPPWPTRICDVRSRRARPRSSSPPWMSRRLARRKIVVMFFSVLLDGADAVGISSGYRKLNILTFIAAGFSSWAGIITLVQIERQPFSIAELMPFVSNGVARGGAPFCSRGCSLLACICHAPKHQAGRRLPT